MTTAVSLEGNQSAEFVRIGARDWKDMASAVLRLERQSFPPSIQDSAKKLRALAESPTGIFLVARLVGSGEIVGYLAADELENFSEVPGIREDRHFGKKDTIYIASVAIREDWQRQGLGIGIQRDCLRLATDAGYRRATAHIVHGAAEQLDMGVRSGRSFDNWYGTGKTFDYVVFSL